VSKFDYTDDIEGALEDITDAGILVTWSVPNVSAGSGNKWDDDTANTPTNYTNTPFLLLPVDKVGRHGQMAIIATEIPWGNQLGYLPGKLAFRPSLKDIAILPNGQRWGVSYVETYEPGGVPILHVMLMAQE
jgi:hypothetical protein